MTFLIHHLEALPKLYHLPNDTITKKLFHPLFNSTKNNILSFLVYFGLFY
jgi:hypothetical protein